ncbi:citrate synthase family protein [Piscinibacter gummiphilus]|uniref:citrate synthase (unknown stereospecificity) n=1 Tax=Piscinibacter gummiphilus TaxID=946333 RepID=A0A1W6L478_9BURK|nr:citrate synthase family protein [Piscinibacter gummiphilus]ARN19034.1 citrate synthase [Piscinibacter gummiphilus]ATU63679.1 citrate synthase [Piscinibacter gummiphilus]GLS93391.1 citrate synthase [Piscinibacter gummiphilus]
MAHWLTLDEARQVLGVRPQTIYAYVSRGRIGVSPDPADSRRSLYRAEDVEGLVQRKATGRTRETLAATTLFGSEPSIPTSISTFSGGRLYYRGVEAVGLAATAGLEDAAGLLWDMETAVNFPAGPASATPPGRVRAFTELASLTATGHSTRGRLPRVLLEESAGLVGRLASAFGAAGDAALPLHERLAKGWGQARPVATLLRKTLVLLADHEITSSAFSARITASTGASLPACLLAGLTTFSGPLHGDASGRVRTLFGEAERDGADAVVDRYLSSGIPIPGFGHPIYPDGDPRAAALMADFKPPAHVARLIDRVVALTGLPPNMDVALASLAARHRLPADAAFAMFAIARSVGLLAHGMEQLGVDSVIRPRGRYTGPTEGLQPAVRRQRRK